MATQEQKMSTSDFNLAKINTKELSDHINATISIGGNIAIFGRRGTGKMLDLETELPTPTGFVKLKDLREGDQLFDERGEVCNVVKLHPITISNEAYEITFDDHSKVKACADHLWFTWDKRARKSHGQAEKPGIFPQVRNTREIVNTLKTTTKKPETNHSIRNAAPVCYPKQELPIDPYVLGCWLGDGDIDGSSIECADEPILQQIVKAGYSINLQPSSVDGGKSCAYRIGDLVPNPNANNKIGLLKLQLRELGLLYNKSIPDIYMHSSPEQRLSLLQGLLDTDGTATSNDHQNEVEFCSVFTKLAYQVWELANSLGIKARIYQNESWLYDQQCKDRYRITFITKMPVFRLERKLANLKQINAQDIRNTHRYIVDAKRIDPIPMRCITVDSPSHLYLITKSFIPTHNTEISKQEIAKLGFHEQYLNISVMERVDLGGYPNVFASQQGREFVNFLMPAFYEKMVKGDKPVVLLLDEVDKADQSLWAPLLEIVQFRSINGMPLPNLHAIIMTGNLISEGGQRPSLPLLDRAEKYLAEADVISWMAWAGKGGHIHPSITAFINDNPTQLFGAVDPEDRYADPSPRGWTRASHIITRGEEMGWDNDMLHNKVRGCVGKQAGILYSIYFDHYRKLIPMVERIYQGENVSHEYRALDPSQQLITCMIACARLSNHLDRAAGNAPPPALQLIGKFFQYVSHENVLAAVRSHVTIDRIVKFNFDEIENWQEIMKSINDKMHR